MKKHLCFLMIFCMIACMFCGCTPSEDTSGNESADNTSEMVSDSSKPVYYVIGELMITTNVYLQKTDFEGEGPFDFYGVPITDIQSHYFNKTEEELSEFFVSGAEPRYIYTITVDDSWRVDDAKQFLLKQEHILSAELADWEVIDTPSDAVNP